MTQEKVSIKIGRTSSAYDIKIGNGLLATCGGLAVESLGRSSGKIAIISNKTVFAIYGKTVLASLTKAGFETSVHLIGDGEKYKSLKTLEKTLTFLGENKLSRTDAVMALGGGVVGDLAGFVASVYLRGIAFLQVPTTLLSMIDSSVGGKTGINTSFGKNLVGAFYQPNGVLIDAGVLATLPRRELTAGFCEAVKQGAISGRKLLDQTTGILEKTGVDSIARKLSDERFTEEFEKFLAAQVLFKASIVANDERESASKTDAKSRKILNFGHTFAHALEKITNYRYLKHGEAVGYGIIFAAELSKKLELIALNEVELLNDVVHRTGVLPTIDHIDPSEVLEAFKYDKKNIGNSLQWVLLNGIGKPVIVSQENIPTSALKSVIQNVIRS
ncbi:MAG TPA: 3-dehydroquinate synthase [Pyrinomonadaceae bacterium]|nr:3-dehydroquinate synthase [Pyrinomonadaceae bacterium]